MAARMFGVFALAIGAAAGIDAASAVICRLDQLEIELAALTIETGVAQRRKEKKVAYLKSKLVYHREKAKALEANCEKFGGWNAMFDEEWERSQMKEAAEHLKKAEAIEEQLKKGATRIHSSDGQVQR